MPKLPRKVAGAGAEAFYHNQLRDFVKSLTPRKSPNTLTTHGLNGVTRKAKPQAARGGSSEFVWL